MIYNTSTVFPLTTHLQYHTTYILIKSTTGVTENCYCTLLHKAILQKKLSPSKYHGQVWKKYSLQKSYFLPNMLTPYLELLEKLFRFTARLG